MEAEPLTRGIQGRSAFPVNPNKEVNVGDRTAVRLHEQLILLAIRDDKGTVESKASMYRFALGGALLAELSLAGRIRVGEGKRALVDLVDRSPLGEPVLDECLGKIAAAKRRRRATTWVARFADVKRLRHRVAEGLCRRGILRDSEKSILLFFRRKVYPTIDPDPKRRLVDRLRSAVFSESPSLDQETAIVVGLANATDLLPIHFEKKDLRRRRRHLKRITKETTVGAATERAVQAERRRQRRHDDVHDSSPTSW